MNLPYAKQTIDLSDIEAVLLALKAPSITRGPLVAAFEQAFASYCQAKYAVAFNSGTSALRAACQSAKVSSFDRIISTPNTFIATVGSGIQCGGKPLLVDIELESGNLSLLKLKEILNRPHSRGRSIIMPVHFSGIPVDMEALFNIIKETEAVVIEDACHALGSTYSNGQKVGSCPWSDMAVFSFHPAKTITTGEGGMVTTNNPELYRLLKVYRNNGIERDAIYLSQNPFPGYYEVEQFGDNYNFTEFQAALGLSQLKRIDTFIGKRQALVAAYRKRLQGWDGVCTFSCQYDKQAAFHLFVVQIDFEGLGCTRKNVMQRLQAKGIGTQVHYIPIYRHPSFQHLFGEQSCQYPNMEQYYRQALSLPLYVDLTESDINYILAHLWEALYNNPYTHKF